jgi:hypothetical protein
VFFEATGIKGFEKYENLNFITLQIKNIKGNTFYKSIEKENPNNEIVKLELFLKHDPIPCMYPHSVFEIKVNDVTITNDNYENTLGKRNMFYSNLRNEIRQELTSIIQTGFIDTSNEIEIITEP